jgi:diguanylate cyclase (GGDEF)-like protein
VDRDGGEAPREEASPVVLLVDGDPRSREATRALLAPRYQVVEAPDAWTAAALSEARPLDAAVVAVGSVGLQGLQQTPGVPSVALVPPGADEPLQLRCFELGAQDVVGHGTPPSLLLARLDRAIRDVRLRRRLEAAARTDALTGLHNFRALQARLREEMERARRYRYPLAAMMIDLDHLKRINDRFGHQAGNATLAAFARQLVRSLRGTDFAARYGGDEFAVLLAHQTADEAAVLTGRLVSGVKALAVRSADGEPLDVSLTISVGIAAYGPGSPKRSGEALLSAADAALYEAKRRGRNRVVIFERDLLPVGHGAGDERS